jgi:EmrB/QacA subfamily drug resistance transporter
MNSTLSMGRAARPSLVLLATSLGVLIAQVDTSVVSLAAKRIGADLGSTVSGMEWIIDAYNVAYAALLLTGGALGDLYGRRRIFACGIGLFALGTVVCAAAPSTGVLLAGRAVSGVGAALELPMSLVLLTYAYPEIRARQRALGIWASCNGLAFIVGPTLGGVLVDFAGWRSIFYLILPLCAAALLLARNAVEESDNPTGRELDVPGQAAAIVALGGFAFLAIEGPHLGWMSSPVIAIAATAALAAIVFARLERGNPAGLVPFGVFESRPFSAALAVACLMTFGMYALLFLMPLYFQTLRGDSPLMAGIRLLPLSVVFVAVSRWNGPIVDAIGTRAAMAAGMVAMGLGEWLCAFVSVDTNGWLIATGLCITGVGLGLNTAPVNSVAVATVPHARAGTASGLLNTARMIGATFGVAILGAVFAHFAGQEGAAGNFISGLRPALAAGGTAELAGALLALRFIARDSGQVQH